MSSSRCRRAVVSGGAAPARPVASWPSSPPSPSCGLAPAAARRPRRPPPSRPARSPTRARRWSPGSLVLPPEPRRAGPRRLLHRGLRRRAGDEGVGLPRGQAARVEGDRRTASAGRATSTRPAQRGHLPPAAGRRPGPARSTSSCCRAARTTGTPPTPRSRTRSRARSTRSGRSSPERPSSCWGPRPLRQARRTAAGLPAACSRATAAAQHLPFVDPLGESWFVDGDGSRYANPVNGHPSNAGYRVIADRFEADVRVLKGSAPS